MPQALPDDQPPRLRFSYRALPVNIVLQFIVRTHAFPLRRWKVRLRRVGSHGARSDAIHQRHFFTLAKTP